MPKPTPDTSPHKCTCEFYMDEDDRTHRRANPTCPVHPADTSPGDELLQKLRRALVSDFKDLYVKEYTTDYKAKRIVQSVEVDVMQLNHVLELINRLMLTREREALNWVLDNTMPNDVTDVPEIVDRIEAIDAQLNKEEK